MFAEEFVQTVIVVEIQLVPVIKSRAFQVLVLNGKAQRAYQVERGSGCRTGTGYVSRILRNFRFMKNNI
jgi:hypothetical protein